MSSYERSGDVRHHVSADVAPELYEPSKETWLDE